MLESASELGEFRTADVVARGPSGEVVQAVPGSLPDEMLSKHPVPDARGADEAGCHRGDGSLVFYWCLSLLESGPGLCRFTQWSRVA